MLYLYSPASLILNHHIPMRLWLQFAAACTFNPLSVCYSGSNPSLLIAVPGHILPQLAQKQQFRCPYCHSVQNVNLAPEVAHQIMSKQQRQDQWQRQSAELAKQRQMQADWAQASSLLQQDHNRLAASQHYSQVLPLPLHHCTCTRPSVSVMGFPSTLRPHDQGSFLTYSETGLAC